MTIVSVEKENTEARTVKRKDTAGTGTAIKQTLCDSKTILGFLSRVSFCSDFCNLNALLLHVFIIFITTFYTFTYNLKVFNP